MANINLVTGNEEGKMLGTGTSALLAVFLVTIAVYFGLFFYGNKLDADTQQLTDEYNDKLKAFVAGDARKVLDFQNRLTISSELLKQSRDNKGDVAGVEEAMVAGVYLDGYKYDNAAKNITLDCYADSYETVAKQILSFKGSATFASVLAGESHFDSESSKINFPVVLTIK
jgi:hypothetical protein